MNIDEALESNISKWIADAYEKGKKDAVPFNKNDCIHLKRVIIKAQGEEDSCLHCEVLTNKLESMLDRMDNN
jgi:hypothetical protein